MSDETTKRDALLFRIRNATDGMCNHQHPGKPAGVIISQHPLSEPCLLRESVLMDEVTELQMRLAQSEDERKRLREALESVLHSTVWGHDHWDRMGTHGTNCLLCIQQGIMRDGIRAALTQGERGVEMKRRGGDGSV